MSRSNVISASIPGICQLSPAVVNNSPSISPIFSFVLFRDLYFSDHGREIGMNAEEWRNKRSKLKEENEIGRETEEIKRRKWKLTPWSSRESPDDLTSKNKKRFSYRESTRMSFSSAKETRETELDREGREWLNIYSYLHSIYSRLLWNRPIESSLQGKNSVRCSSRFLTKSHIIIWACK